MVLYFIATPQDLVMARPSVSTWPIAVGFWSYWSLFSMIRPSFECMNYGKKKVYGVTWGWSDSHDGFLYLQKQWAPHSQTYRNAGVLILRSAFM
jgi:hypothetical protein